MTLRATMTPVALLEYLANHRDIITWVAPGHKTVDVSHHNVRGAAIFGTPAGAVFFTPIDLDDGLYEMHYLFTEEVRGKAALDIIRESVKVMFTERGATAMYGLVPREHRASRVMSRALGARPNGLHTDNSGRACILYELERKSWAASSAVS